jgi:hypothetical protein
MGTKPSATLEWRTANAGANTPITTVTTGIQRVQWRSGRNTISDQWSAGGCIISGIGFLSSEPVIGNYARVTVTDGATSTKFYGLVADYTKNYGIKSTMDTFELRLEGCLAAFGRVTVTTSWAAGVFWTRPITDLSVQLSPVQVRLPSVSYSTETISASSTTDLYGNVTYPAITTGQAVLREVGDEDWPGSWTLSPVVNVYDRNDPTNLYQLVGTFADDGTGSGYNNIQFLSSSYTYGTRVTVDPLDVASQTSGSGLYTQTFTSYDQTTTQALNLAGYIRVSLDNAANVPYSITFEGSGSSAGYIALTNPNKIKQAVNVKLRGTTYNCVIEGLEFDADPANWRCTLYLSSSLQNAFLRLDDAVYGKLDTNKLGL